MLYRTDRDVRRLLNFQWTHFLAQIYTGTTVDPFNQEFILMVQEPQALHIPL